MSKDAAFRFFTFDKEMLALAKSMHFETNHVLEEEII